VIKGGLGADSLAVKTWLLSNLTLRNALKANEKLG
jgi:hypothetical protein